MTTAAHGFDSHLPGINYQILKRRPDAVNLCKRPVMNRF
jgi:hypothetical protein